MSFGALSLEAKMALAKGALDAPEHGDVLRARGGMISPERDYWTKSYYQCIQSRSGSTRADLMLADAVEFFIGRAKVGLGGHLMGQKVTEQAPRCARLPADRPALPAAIPTGSATTCR